MDNLLDTKRIPQASTNKAEVLRFIAWLYQDAERVRLANLGIEGEHFLLQDFSFIPIEPVRYRGVYLPVIHSRFQLPDATRTEFWYEARAKLENTPWRTDHFSALTVAPVDLSMHPAEVEFNTVWWQFLEGTVPVTRERYAELVSRFFQNGGAEIASQMYRNYAERR